MRVKLVLLVLGLILITSCTYEQPAKSVTYVIEEKQPLVFVIEQEDPLAWEKDTKQNRFDLNTFRSLRDFKDEQEEFKIKSRLFDVRRFIDGKIIIGFDEDLDNPDFKDPEKSSDNSY